MPQTTSETFQPAFRENLNSLLLEKGWVRMMLPIHQPLDLTATKSALDELLSSIGKPIRSRRLAGPLKPSESVTARLRSLSAMHGMGAFPLHTDTAHWTIPARFVGLCRIDTTEAVTTTRLMDTRGLWTADDQMKAERAIFLIRNGKHSFYDTVLSARRPFIRLDGGCMEPTNSEGIEIMNMVDAFSEAPDVTEIALAPGEGLIIDNWRMLHGRAAVNPAGQSRELVRSLAS